MTEVVVYALHDVDALVGFDNEFVCAARVFSPKSIAVEEEVGAITKESRILFVREVGWSLEVF
jgi:hypothetical protein